MDDLPDRFRHLSDGDWLNALLRSVQSPFVDGFKFPTYPNSSRQAQFVGDANEAAIRAAYDFFVYTKSRLQLGGAVIRRNARFLDFGTGWGRLMRVFWKEFRAENMFGVDVDPTALSDCVTNGVAGNFAKIEPLGQLGLDSGSVSLVTAYSVFSHLPESVHLHWLREIHRVMAPGGLFVATLEPRRFIDFVERANSDPTNSWMRTIGSYAPQATSMREKFDIGDFIYLGTGGGAYRPEETYGEAIIPFAYIERVWSEWFEIDGYLDDEKRFWQAVVSCRKRIGSGAS